MLQYIERDNYYYKEQKESINVEKNLKMYMLKIKELYGIQI